MQAGASSPWLSLLFVGILAMGLTLVVSNLAPAAESEPEPKVFEHRALSLEWRGTRRDPDLDRMFRRSDTRRGWVNDTFRRPH